MDDYGSDYGYMARGRRTRRISSSWDAYNAGDSAGSSYWNDQSWSDWNQSTDMYVGGADPCGSTYTSDYYAGSEYSYE
ncbi:hypothetical protein [Smaragdicoccus niigatensis]|uniref:hypothetical protein n=1 Tax=Smaragdicoccus niigatensis TaxID=359359 RepID=UPI00036D7D47|nr:hypothetical protein [Smaragdicoccus niigatensis]